jgi:hypothetical protein
LSVKPEQDLKEGFRKLFLELVSVFIEARKTLNVTFYTTGHHKNVKISALI